MTDPLVITDKGALATARKLESIQLAIRELQLIEAELKVDLRSIAAWHGQSIKIGSFTIEEYAGEHRSMYAITEDES